MGPAASTGKSPPNLLRDRYRRLSRMTRWLGEYGLSWGSMGVNGSTLPRNTALAGRLASGKLKEWLRSRRRTRVRIATSRVCRVRSYQRRAASRVGMIERLASPRRGTRPRADALPAGNEWVFFFAANRSHAQIGLSATTVRSKVYSHGPHCISRRFLRRRRRPPVAES